MKYLTIIALLTLILANTSCDSANRCRESIIRENALSNVAACSSGAKISVEIVNDTTYIVCKCGEHKKTEDGQVYKLDAGSDGGGGDYPSPLPILQ